MKLISKTGTEITGTLEQIEGIAFINGAAMIDGRLEVEYAGETDVMWDTQCTRTDVDGKRLFIDAAGATFTEDEVKLCLAAAQ